MNAFVGEARPGIIAWRWSRWLGYAGLLPFAPALILPWIHAQPLASALQDAVLAYGAVILSFVGALHWQAGLYAKAARESAIRLSFSVLPALLGWLALLLQPVTAFALLIAGFLMVYRFDRRWRRDDNWFLQLRRRLTAGAALCLSVGLGAALYTL
jgi:hypothetical protein